MTSPATFNYKKEANRYRYYYQRLYIFYQKPVVQVSSAVLFTIAIIIFFAVFAIRPTLQTISELLRKIEDQKKVLTLAQKKSSALATAQQQLDQVQNNLPALTSAIPERYAVQELLRDIEATAGTLNIPISGIKIRDLEYPPAQASDPVENLIFTISLDAPYPATKQFIIALSKLPRLVSVEEISVTTPEDMNPTAGEKLALSTNIKCRIFFSKGKTEQ